MKRITENELLELPFGSTIRVMWHNSKHYEDWGVIYGNNIGWEAGSTEETRILAESIHKNRCICYLIE